MHPDDPRIRKFLAAALRKDVVSWPPAWADPQAIEAAGHGAIFHGVGGLLVEQDRVNPTWPERFIDLLRNEARARAMWELRHRQLLTEVLANFAEQAIPCLIMKGTAVAYDLYPNPSARSRGDTDLLVDLPDVAAAKALLAELGYVGGVLGGVTSEFSLQQVWIPSLPDGGYHTIDLHWQVMNAPSLRDVLKFADCWAHSRPLPRLSPKARTMDPVRLMIHTCLHRAMQCNAAYVVDGATYFDPWRLIWLWDIHLMAQAFGERDWSTFLLLTGEMGVSRPCLDALQAVHADFGTEVPVDVKMGLERAAAGQRLSPYFVRSPALVRAWHDLRSVAGVPKKLRYMLSRVVTTEQFLRGKYPGGANLPLPLLYGRRLLDLVWRKPNAD